MFFCLLLDNIVLPAEDISKNKNKEEVVLKSWSNYVAQHTWTDFQHNLGPLLPHFLQFGVFVRLKPLLIVFPANKFSRTPQKTNKALFVSTNCTNCSFQNVLFVYSSFWASLEFPILGELFFDRLPKNQKKYQIPRKSPKTRCKQ